MARRRRPATEQNNVQDFRHDKARRKNNPPAGVAPTYEVRERQSTRYAYDPHLDPQLQWAGKTEHTSFEVPTVSLHVPERIDPTTVTEAVRKKNSQQEPMQLRLFEIKREESLLKAIAFYQHKHGWTNHLIAGHNLLVMTFCSINDVLNQFGG